MLSPYVLIFILTVIVIIIRNITFNLNKVEKRIIINVLNIFRNCSKLIIKKIINKLPLYRFYDYFNNFIERKQIFERQIYIFNEKILKHL